MRKTAFLLLSLCLLLSCRTYKTTHLVEGVNPISFDKAEFILDTLSYSSRVYVGEFKVFDGLPWDTIQHKTKKLALSNQANAIWVGDFSNRGISMKGKLYQIDPQELVAKRHFEPKMKLYLFRDELGSPLAKAFSCSLRLNGKPYTLKDQGIIEVELEPDAQEVEISLNGNSHTFPLQSGANYIWVYRNLQAGGMGSGISVSVGGYLLEDIQDPIRGALWLRSLKKAED